MTFTLNGTTLPSHTGFDSKTSWVAAQRDMLNGSQGVDVTANLRSFSVDWFMLTTAQRNTIRTLFYTNTPQRLIVSDRTIDCYVFCQSLTIRRTLYGNYPWAIKLTLLEHGAAFDESTEGGLVQTTAEPTPGVSSTWQLGAVGAEAALPTPNEYAVEYTKAHVIHQLANGTVWMDVLGIARRFTLTYQSKAIADVDVFRTQQALKAALHFLTPTTWDSVDTTVVSRELPEAQDTKMAGTIERVDVVLSETGGAAITVPSCKVELDHDGDGDYSEGTEDISAYVTEVTLDRQGINTQAGPSGIGGGISHEARIGLRHAGGLFSPFHADARLTDKLYGKLIRISLGWGGSPTAVFTGRVLASNEALKQRKAGLLARDLGAFLLQHKRGDTTLYQNTPTKTYLAAILTAAGMTEGAGAGQYQLDTGNYALAFAWMDRETYAAECDMVAQMEGGRVFWDMAGCFRFEAADHLLGHASDETFTVANMADLEIDWDVDNIANRVIVESTTRYIAVQQVIWSAQEIYRVPARIKAGACAAGSTATAVNLNVSDSTFGADTLKGEWLRLTSGTYSGETRRIKSNTVTDGGGITAVTVETAFSGAPALTDGYILGGILEMKARFNYPSTGIVTPVAWTKALQDANGEYDYQALTGGGDAATTNLTVAMTAYAASAKFYLINASTTQPAFMQRLQLRGMPVLSREMRRVEEYDQASIDAYQERDPLLLADEQANVYVQNEVQARAVAQMLLGRFKDPHAYLRLNGLKGLATREIGQRKTVVETQSGLNSDWFVVAINDRYSPQNGGYTQDLVLVDAAMLGVTSDGGVDWFVLGTSKYGTGAGHAHLWY